MSSMAGPARAGPSSCTTAARYSCFSRSHAAIDTTRISSGAWAVVCASRSPLSRMQRAQACSSGRRRTISRARSVPPRPVGGTMSRAAPTGPAAAVGVATEPVTIPVTIEPVAIGTAPTGAAATGVATTTGATTTGATKTGVSATGGVAATAANLDVAGVVGNGWATTAAAGDVGRAGGKLGTDPDGRIRIGPTDTDPTAAVAPGGATRHCRTHRSAPMARLAGACRHSTMAGLPDKPPGPDPRPTGQDGFAAWTEANGITIQRASAGLLRPWPGRRQRRGSGDAARQPDVTARTVESACQMV